MGSGGNPRKVGTHGPTGASSTTGATWQSAADQKMAHSRQNLAMISKSESGGRVSVIVAGDLLGKNEYFPISTRPACVYLGPYCLIGDRSFQDNWEDIGSILELYNVVFTTEMDEMYLNYRLKNHRRFNLKADGGVPFSNPTEKWEEWTHLHVWSGDSRKICMEVPNGKSSSQIFGVIGQPIFSEDVAISNFFRRVVTKSLLDFPLHHGLILSKPLIRKICLS